MPRRRGVDQRAVAMLALVAVALPAAQALGGAARSFGVVRGRVVWTGKELPGVRALQIKGNAERDPEVCARYATIVDDSLVVERTSRGVASALAYLVEPQGTNPEAEAALLTRAPRIVVDQKNCVFMPRITAMHQDQELVFASNDRVNHNVHLTPLRNAVLNQVMAAETRLSVRLVAERRAIPLKCHLHPWMSGAVRVFSHPFYAKTEGDGAFEIRGVPAGVQRIAVWHERTGELTPRGRIGRAITVPAGGAVDLGEIALGPEQLKDTH